MTGGGGPVHPVSVKGVLVRDGRVCLLRNERAEWELPGGRLEPGEQPEACLAREVVEELGLRVEVVRPPVRAWLFEVVPGRHVFVVAYRCREVGEGAPRVSAEHSALGWFAVEDLDGIPLPGGYAEAVRVAVAPR